MRKITDYKEFILESKLELLLEANIVYTNKFKDILKSIESPISTMLITLAGKEVDVNTNYIDINTDKKDVILFTPDNKTLKLPLIVTESGYSYSGSAHKAKNSGYPIGELANPEQGQQVELVKKLSTEEVELFFNGGNYKISHIKFKIDSEAYTWGADKEFEAFYLSEYLEVDISSIKKSEVKIGRFVNSILKKADFEFKPTDVEDFVSKYKTAIQIRNDAFDRFEIVSGDDIKKYYNEESYYQTGSGTLGTSCMRYSRCEEYLNIYSENPDQVSLIIIKSLDDSEKIIGRAILWTDSKDRKFMDRTYVIDHSNVILFIEYAIKNGYYYKRNQTYSDDTQIMFNGLAISTSDSIIKVKLEVGGTFDSYPYCDTLKYYNTETSIITNDSDGSYNSTLTDTDGGDGSCNNCGGSGDVECGDCNGSGEDTCYECNGEGEVDCSDCDGDGHNECYDCDGDGEIECSNCDGSGTDDDEECGDCDGSGNVSCNNCGGDGSNTCDTCDGSALVGCSDCDGEGNVTCNNCGGDGRYDCYDCN
jgi:hypothetical protein